jgi:hypothetical protein
VRANENEDGFPGQKASDCTPQAEEIRYQIPFIIAATQVATSTAEAPALNRYVADRLGVSQSIGSWVAWQLVLNVVGREIAPVDLPSGRGLRPLVAARHLLGLVSYARDERGNLDRRARIPDVKRSAEELDRHVKTSFYPFDPFSRAGQRRVIAALAGGWRSKDPRSLLVPRPSGHPNALQDMAAVIWELIDADLNDSSVTGPLLEQARSESGAARQAPDGGESAEPPGPKSSSLRASWRKARPEYPTAGWGPEREVFTIAAPAPYPTFNSIVDNPAIGDERNFVGLRKTDAVPEMLWQSDVWASPGDRYVMRIYVNNAGADNHGIVGAGWLQQAKLRITLEHGRRGHALHAVLSAVNARTVWDGATIHVDEGVGVEFVSGTLKIENNAFPGPDGLSLAQARALDDGVLLGYAEMDGQIRPGYPYASFVTIQLAVG